MNAEASSLKWESVFPEDEDIMEAEVDFRPQDSNYDLTGLYYELVG